MSPPDWSQGNWIRPRRKPNLETTSRASKAKHCPLLNANQFYKLFDLFVFSYICTVCFWNMESNWENGGCIIHSESVQSLHNIQSGSNLNNCKISKSFLVNWKSESFYNIHKVPQKTFWGLFCQPRNSKLLILNILLR